MSDQLLARARLTACRKWPHATSAILSLVPVEKPGLGTCAVDQFWRLYWDPAFLAKCSADEAAGVILHEVSHCLLNHAKRASTLVPKSERELFKVWNIAADAAINYALQQESIALPQGVVYPTTLKLPGNQSAEWYFQKLKEQMREEGRAVSGRGDPADAAGEGQPGGCPGVPGNDPADGAEPGNKVGAPGSDAGVSPGTSGSCADGQPRDWEAPAPSGDEAQDEAEGTPPGLAPHEQQQIAQQVAEALKARGTMRGNVWAGFVEEVLNPKVDPRTLLMRAVRHAVDQVTGGSDEYSYRRPSRRPSLGGTVRATPMQIVPRITVILDVSGSMGREDIGLGAGLIAKVLSGLRLRDGIRVLVGDTCVQKAATIFDPKKIEVYGRGGTDMAAIIEAAAEEKPVPDVIICATDGETNYPAKPVGPKVVIALTRKSSYCSPPPAWMKTVCLARD